MAIFGLLLFFGAIIAFEVPGMVKKKLWRELVVFSVILVIGMIYTLGSVIEMNLLPNPAKIMEFIFEPSANAIVKMLKS